LVGWLVGWLFGQLVSQSVWLIGWLISSDITHTSLSPDWGDCIWQEIKFIALLPCTLQLPNLKCR